MNQPADWNTLEHRAEFVRRHIGPDSAEVGSMLESLGLDSLEALVDQTVPEVIRSRSELDLPDSMTEREVVDKIRGFADQNRLMKSYIGLGYSGTLVPAVIQRNILENPGWYTAYTPYQAEISQGRMEALLNYQTMVSDLTGREIANSSLLDEGTAAAEAMSLTRSIQKKNPSSRFLVSDALHPQTIEVVETRAEPLGIEVVLGRTDELVDSGDGFALVVGYPDTYGQVRNLEPLIERAHASGMLVIVVADLLSLLLFKSPGAQGADVVIGNSQRFGVPMGFGGPHAAFFATREEHKRQVPGRIIGVSKDSRGRSALRLALQTREQHIRREKATSNICTAQVLLAVMAGAYAVYHGREGLERIARRVHRLTSAFRTTLADLGYQFYEPESGSTFFDTLSIEVGPGRADEYLGRAVEAGYNLRRIDSDRLGVAFDETTTRDDLEKLTEVFARGRSFDFESTLNREVEIPAALRRTDTVLDHPVFEQHHSETEMLRYLKRLENRDLSLTTSMIPLGSCTMKLNATTEMVPVTWPEFGSIHPFAPLDQARGYLAMIGELEDQLKRVTGFPGISLQPNSGSQGEYTGLLVIRKYHLSREDTSRNVCLIPESAHGTNPASAAMAGMKVVVVKCDEAGNVDVEDLKQKASEHSETLSALMVTYPSTHGVFEVAIRDICKIVHDAGGQVYMDGANTNAIIGLCQPGEFGPDVMHLNLHKTFCIPHGGGGPGVGPIGVADHLCPFLPTHSLVPECGPKTGVSAVSAAPWGSASILPISWAYITAMGRSGLKRATQVAILNANYIAKRLEGHYPILYTGLNDRVAHECIIDVRPLKEYGIEVDDIAKRLMDFNFHAPTMSWPVAGTLMIEPTESESQEELDRFCEAMIAIRDEVRQIERGEIESAQSPLKFAPHTIHDIAGDWERAYSREQAVFPLEWVREQKFWPAVNRVDNAFGDRNLVCLCPPIEAYAE